MRFASLMGWGASRAFRAVVLIVTLFLGATFHEWHHLQDPACTGGSHCVCSVLHSSTLVAAETSAPVPECSIGPAPVVAPVAPPRATARATASPRAPPEA